MTAVPVRVSVVVPIFNAQNFLSETIDSVLGQTFASWEAILVDDGSTDGSLSVAEGYARKEPERIRVERHEGGTNRGVCASRNLGIEAAKGEYIALLDADDVWLPTKLEEQVAILDANSTAGMVFGHTLYWQSWDSPSEAGGTDGVPSFGIETDRLYPAKALNVLLYPLTKRTAPNPSDLLLRREVVVRVGGFDERFHGDRQLYEDQAFLSKVYLNAPVFISSRTWLCYRIHASSFSAQRLDALRPALFLDFLEWFEAYLDGIGETDREVRRMVKDALFPFRHPKLHNYAVKRGWRSAETVR